jgi:hypothetical protein
MSIVTEHITAEQLRAIMFLEEGHFADLKRIEVMPAKLTK